MTAHGTTASSRSKPGGTAKRRTTPASTTRRTTAPRTPAGAAAAAPQLPPHLAELLGDVGLEPVRLSSTAPMPDEGPRIPVFYIDDVEYSIPAEPPMNWAVQLLDSLGSGREDIMAAGQVLAMRRMLGHEGYNAFVSYKQLTDAQYRTIMLICMRALTGRVEDPKDSR